MCWFRPCLVRPCTCSVEVSSTCEANAIKPGKGAEGTAKFTWVKKSTLIPQEQEKPATTLTSESLDLGTGAATEAIPPPPLHPPPPPYAPPPPPPPPHPPSHYAAPDDPSDSSPNIAAVEGVEKKVLVTGESFQTQAPASSGPETSESDSSSPNQTREMRFVVDVASDEEPFRSDSEGDVPDYWDGQFEEDEERVTSEYAKLQEVLAEMWLGKIA